MELKRYKDFIIESKEENIWTYEGDFDVDESMILNGKFIKDKIPVIITGDFHCSYMKLTSLEGGPKEVKGDFECHDNLLISLKGCPDVIGGYLDCSFNHLTSLKGCPEKVNGNFDCTINQLISLEECSKEIGVMYSDLEIEQEFINSKSYINDYWKDLLKYMIKEKIDLSKVEGWPEGFLNDETIKSSKGLSKFNL